jgi:hypothetical protein
MLRTAGTGWPPLFDTIDPDRIRGSGHITAMSRVAWALTTVQTGARPDPNGPPKLQVIKSNLARHPDPLGIVLEQLAGGQHVRVVYDREAPEPYKEPTERDAAGEWLLEYLEAAGKPVSPKEVIAAAKEAGFGRSTIYTPWEELKDEIVNTAGRRSAGTCWRLASLGAVRTQDRRALRGPVQEVFSFLRPSPRWTPRAAWTPWTGLARWACVCGRASADVRQKERIPWGRTWAAPSLPQQVWWGMAPAHVTAT